jgi:hypothetical protein
MTSNESRLGRMGLVAIAVLCAIGSPIVAQEQGIKVHGRWAIDVRNTDGSLASHHEFDNSLTTVGVSVGGNSVLAGLLGRHFTTVGDWHVMIWRACGTEAFPQACRISEPTFPNQSSGVFRNLRITVPTRTVSFPAIGNREVPIGTVEFAGEATATLNRAIEAVSTQLGLCPTGTNCFMGSDITSHTLETPIPVVAGQIIQVRVVLSFS